MANCGNISRRDVTSVMLWRVFTSVMLLAAVSQADGQKNTPSVDLSARDVATDENADSAVQDRTVRQMESRDAGVALSSPGKYEIAYKGFNYAESSPANFPGMDYGLMGYDILKGYPLAIGHDPGFTLPIFLADYSGGLTTADASWSLPKGVFAAPDVSCITSFSSEVVKSSRALSKSLEASVSASGGGWGVSFSASAGYQEASSEVSSGEYVLIISKATCKDYFMQVKIHDPPPLDPSFVKWVIQLNNTNDDNDFIDFVETYGTHYVHKVVFGASFTYEHKMTSSDYENEISSGVDVSVSASYSGFVSVAGEASVSSNEAAAAADFRSKVTTRTITIGSPPPENGDALTWAATVSKNPLPVKYSLMSIVDLFSNTVMRATSSLNSIDYNSIKEKIIAAQRSYCKRLLSEGLVSDCSDHINGLSLENTRLTGTFRRYANVKSYSDCIDLCYDLAQCEAVDFCEECTSLDSDYHVCRVYSTSALASGLQDSKWETAILIPDVKDLISLNGTGVRGQQRVLAPTSDAPTSSVYGCFMQCAADEFCVAFTKCDCPEMKHQCKYYSDVLYQLTTESDSTLYFVSPDVKLNPPTFMSRKAPSNLWSGMSCTTDSDCLGQNTECVSGTCLCSLSTSYTISRDKCVSSCSQADLQTSFMGPYDNMMINQSNAIVVETGSNQADCLSECRQRSNCRVAGLDSSNRCYLYTKSQGYSMPYTTYVRACS